MTMVFFTSRRGWTVGCKVALSGAIGPTSVDILAFSLAVTLLGYMIIPFTGGWRVFNCSVIHICGEVGIAAIPTSLQMWITLQSSTCLPPAKKVINNNNDNDNLLLYIRMLLVQVA